MLSATDFEKKFSLELVMQRMMEVMDLQKDLKDELECEDGELDVDYLAEIAQDLLDFMSFYDRKVPFCTDNLNFFYHLDLLRHVLSMDYLGTEEYREKNGVDLVQQLDDEGFDSVSEVQKSVSFVHVINLTYHLMINTKVLSEQAVRKLRTHGLGASYECQEFLRLRYRIVSYLDNQVPCAREYTYKALFDDIIMREDGDEPMGDQGL